MRKIMALSFVFMVVAIIAAAVFPPTGRFAFPAGQGIENIADNVRTAEDSIGPADAVVYGPYRLVMREGKYPYSAIRLYYPRLVMRSKDSMRVHYQLLPSDSLSDTLAAWTFLDTVFYTGKVSRAIGVRDSCVQSIVFRLMAVGDSAIISKATEMIMEQ